MSDLAQRVQQALGETYRVTEEIGAGGMSRVFVAQEIELGRDIVVKVLPPELSAGLNIDRFRREIQMAARLQHPHIVPLLFAGSRGGLLYYSMPRIDGESLRSRIARSGELPIGESTRLLRDVADALGYAHAHGIVHRDIKPDNILVSGHHAFVTDFGVAKALSVSTGESHITSAGVAIGTPAYMSPEQASADPKIDHRTDIYALGVLGYEMLSGRPPFSGTTQQQILAAQVTNSPVPISTRRANVPAPVASLIMRCLEKSPEDRFQSAEEMREQLEMAGRSSGETAPNQAAAARNGAKARGRLKKTLVLGGVATVLLVGSLIASRYLGGGRREFELGATQQVTNDRGIEITPALSPDGKLLAYAGGDPAHTSIFIRRINGGETIRLASGRAPQWSSDGARIVYVDPTRSIATISALGGSPRLLVRLIQFYLLSPVWSHDGKSLAYAERDAFIANADGTEPRRFLSMKEAHSFSWSPDDSRLAFAQGNRQFIYSAEQFGNIAPSTVWIARRDGKGATAITDQIHHNLSPVWTTDGEGILYVSNIHGGRDLYYQRIRDTKAAGPPQRLTTGLGIHGISMGGEGRIAYSLLNTSVGIWSMPLPRTGTVSFTTGHQLTSATERIEALRLSPDGQWLAFDSDRSGNMDIYKMRIDGSGLQQLTRNPADEFLPSWSPDGRQIAFHSWRSGNRDSYVMSADGGSERPIAAGPEHEWAGVWSPDGSKIAFQSDRLGDIEIFITSATGGASRQLTADGGGDPNWSPDGAFIAYAATEGLRVVRADGGPYRILVSDSLFGPVTSVRGWSSDSRRIFFRVRAPNGDLNIAQVFVDGSNPSLLVRFDQPDRRAYRPEFTTDGKTLYFTVGKHEADIWVIDLKRK